MKRQRCNQELINKVAKRIKQLRDDKGISQDTFYIDTDIHIGRIEAGNSNITISTLNDICKYLDVSLSQFFDGIK